MDQHLTKSSALKSGIPGSCSLQVIPPVNRAALSSDQRRPGCEERTHNRRAGLFFRIKRFFDTLPSRALVLDILALMWDSIGNVQTPTRVSTSKCNNSTSEVESRQGTVTCLDVTEPRVDNVHPDTNVCVNAVEHVIRLGSFAFEHICPYSPLDAFFDSAEDLGGKTGTHACGDL